MKKWTLKVALMVITLGTLTACPDKDKSSAPAPAPVTPGVDGNGLCIPDQSGQCPGTTPFVGRGTWSGTLLVSSQSNHFYRAFLNEHGLCNSFWCNRMLTEWVMVTIRIHPSQARVSITPWLNYGWGREQFSQNGSIFAMNGGAGFQIMLRDDRYYIQGPNGLGLRSEEIPPPAPNQQVPPQVFPQPITAPQNGLIQLTGTFNGQQSNSVNVNLYYRGNLIATGQLLGFRYY